MSQYLEILRAIATPDRLPILLILADGPLDLRKLCARLGKTPTQLGATLTRLKRFGLLEHIQTTPRHGNAIGCWQLSPRTVQPFDDRIEFNIEGAWFAIGRYSKEGT